MKRESINLWNILWIPHDAWNTGVYRRDQHFINRLKNGHNIIVLIWEGVKNKNLMGYVQYLFLTFLPLRYTSNGIKIYKMPKFPTPGKPWHFPHSLFRKMNEIILNAYYSFISKREKIDITITGPNAAFVGYIKRKKNPVVFDLLDCSDWSSKNPWMEMERKYFLMSNGVIAVSPVAYSIASNYNKNTLLLPNGVEIEHFEIMNKEEAKRRLGFGGMKTISIIGPTFSERFYFMEAILSLLEKHPDLVFFIVGEDKKVKKLKSKYKNIERIRFIPYVYYQYVNQYFIATDIGLYPVDESPYFNCAVPLKVLEYAAAGSWVVVSPRLKGVEYLNLPNVVFSQDNADSLMKTIEKLLNRKPPEAKEKLKQFHWSVLTERLEEFLYNLIKGQ